MKNKYIYHRLIIINTRNLIMAHLIFRSVIMLVIAIPTAYLVLRYFFKNSILFKIALLWMTTLLFIIVNTRFTDFYPQYYPYPLAVIIAIVISCVAIALVNKMVKIPFQKIIIDIERVAKGEIKIDKNDLRINEKNELGVLYRSVVILSDRLKGAFYNLQQISEKINQIGHALNSTSMELSNSTSDQASSLEEISASMEEMVANIQMNSENSGKTEKIALDANLAVKKGNDSAVTALESIKEIAANIKIINDIAFQTNILALNAAVEAAHAGEQGKGFAVVAIEVRKLAQESKKAANKIEAMTNHGSKISEEAIQLLNSTLPLMQQTSNLIQDISSASQEQSDGSMQINTSIQSMNASTQTNAITADRITSYSKDLLEQAELLLKNTKYFQTR